MSIIIKGMDMPKDCSECILADEHINGLCEKKYYCRLGAVQTFTAQADFERCPLVEISTPHGRLIDKDELLSHIKKDPLFDLVERYGISGVIESRPTILEAEE